MHHLKQSRCTTVSGQHAPSGAAYSILKDNEPKYLLIDLDQEALIYDLTEEEKLEITSKRILRQYRPAFKELPKF